jgi:ribonucleotide monophosphatase NagD (HAD superfamily)
MPIHTSPAERSSASARRARKLIYASAALLVDWDGCLAFGERLAPGAAKFLQEHADHIAIVSNNTTHLPDDFVAFLAHEGVTLARERVILAGPVTVDRAARESSRALVLANARLRHLAQSVGLETDAANPEAVVLLRDTQFTYKKLQRAANAIHDGARLYVGNPDLTHPDANGTRVRCWPHWLLLSISQT